MASSLTVALLDATYSFACLGRKADTSSSIDACSSEVSMVFFLSGARLALGLLTSLNFTPGIAPPASDLPTVSYSYSHDPSAVLLFVQVFAPQVGSSRSFTLYGDGRVELLVRPAGQQSDSHSEFRLSPEEIDRLLQGAVDCGLAEWDATRIEAEQLKANDGREFLVVDGAVVHVSLALETFRRGDWMVRDLRKSIRVRSPRDMAERFPGIKEYEGIARLVDYLHAALSRAPEGK